MRLSPERSPIPRLLAFPAAVLLGFAARLSFTQADALHEAARCRLREVTSLPCPTCGGTLAFVSVARGEWTAAFRANPVVTLVLIWLLAWVVYGLAATAMPRWRRQVDLTATEKKGVRIAVVAAILLAWAYQFIRIG